MILCDVVGLLVGIFPLTYYVVADAPEGWLTFGIFFACVTGPLWLYRLVSDVLQARREREEDFYLFQPEVPGVPPADCVYPSDKEDPDV